MKKAHLIVPLVLLAGFLGFERDYSWSRAARNRHLAAEVATTKAAEAVRLEALREKAASDARLRNETREVQEREHAAKKLRTQAAALRAIEDQADAQTAAADKVAGESLVLELQLGALRARHDSLDRDSAELARELDAHRASRRTAELALQQTASRFVARLHETVGEIAPLPSR